VSDTKTERRVSSHRRSQFLSCRTLVLTRHGQSEWNKLNLFTGWKDPKLTEQGEAEAKKGAVELKKYGYTDFDMAFTSALTRAQTTLEIQLKEIGQIGLTTTKDQALNERDYGGKFEGGVVIYTSEVLTPILSCRSDRPE
jgi:bisphosphoglycerate-dependent phosphoglycerate mutase family 1